jgi:hypothetical protein
MVAYELELHTIADKIIEQEQLEDIDIQFKNTHSGSAKYYTRKITIPFWIFDTVWEYQIYYMIHELSHFINYDKFNGFGHTPKFKEIEQALLKEYNIYIKYAKAYPKYLYNGTGEIICGKLGDTLDKTKKVVYTCNRKEKQI